MAVLFRVVVNSEGQYSIWPLPLAIPYGWADVGWTGEQDDCLAYIENTWTDMRPVSIRAQNPDKSKVSNS
jgi:MbtH protein